MKKAAVRKSATVMKEIDASKKRAVTLTFLLDRKISPHELAQLIAHECGGDVLRPGEAIRVDHAKIACVVTSQPHFDWQWQRSLKEPKRPKLLPNRCK